MKYFEDFEIGQRRETGSCKVTREEIIAFAREFDPQPFHIDEEAARASIFGGLTGSSCHTFALMGRIHHQAGQPMALVANLGGNNLRFPNPLRPDDEIFLSSECVAMRKSESRPDVGIVTTRSRLRNQRDELVMEMDTTFMVRRRPEPDADASR